MKSLLIFGAGGHGSEVLWLLKNINQVEQRFRVLGFCDDCETLKGGTFCDLPIFGTPEELDPQLAEKPYFFAAVGDNCIRKQVVERMEALAWQPVTLIDPSAVVAESSRIGVGSYVGVASNISPNAQVGRHAIVHNQSSVGHDTRMQDFSQVAPGGRLLGHARLEMEAYVGANAVVYPRTTLGASAVLAACSFALKDIPANSTAMGVPAKLYIRSQKSQESI
jgi:sugar O-acyltransferase (sialic acid O-acetyltransferase NeuD family)